MRIQLIVLWTAGSVIFLAGAALTVHAIYCLLHALGEEHHSDDYLQTDGKNLRWRG